jgi:hypothetical protein
MKPVKLSELIEAVEFDSDEFGSWVDLQSGGVVRLAHSLISAVEDSDDEAPEAFVRDWAEAHQVPLSDDANPHATS